MDIIHQSVQLSRLQTALNVQPVFTLTTIGFCVASELIMGVSPPFCLIPPVYSVAVGRD
jgi:hypothetical protein